MNPIKQGIPRHKPLLLFLKIVRTYQSALCPSVVPDESQDIENVKTIDRNRILQSLGDYFLDSSLSRPSAMASNDPNAPTAERWELDQAFRSIEALEKKLGDKNNRISRHLPHPTSVKLYSSTQQRQWSKSFKALQGLKDRR